MEAFKQHRNQKDRIAFAETANQLPVELFWLQARPQSNPTDRYQSIILLTDTMAAAAASAAKPAGAHFQCRPQENLPVCMIPPALLSHLRAVPLLTFALLQSKPCCYFYPPKEEPFSQLPLRSRYRCSSTSSTCGTTSGTCTMLRCYRFDPWSTSRRHLPGWHSRADVPPAVEKLMMAELESPFVWPEPPAETERSAFDYDMWKRTDNERDEHLKLRQDMISGKIPLRTEQEASQERSALADEAKAILEEGRSGRPARSWMRSGPIPVPRHYLRPLLHQKLRSHPHRPESRQGQTSYPRMRSPLQGGNLRVRSLV